MNSLRILIVCATMLPTLACGVAKSADTDLAGAADHPLVGRYAGSVITRYEHTRYEELGLPREAIPAAARNLPRPHLLPVAGAVTTIGYEGPAGRSALEVVRNFQSSLAAAGFELLFECRAETCGGAPGFWDAARGGLSIPSQWATNTYALLSLDRPAGRVWVSVFAVETRASANRPLMPHAVVRVVEAQAMESGKIEVIEADALHAALQTGGRVALYGIEFDLDTDALRADSQAQIAEIAALLKQHPAMHVLVVGHTDATGTLDYNRDLSQRRAAAVVRALGTMHGIAAGRMLPVGVGPAAPVASNRTSDGKARNRRVEIVELLQPPR